MLKPTHFLNNTYCVQKVVCTADSVGGWSQTRVLQQPEAHTVSSSVARVAQSSRTQSTTVTPENLECVVVALVCLLPSLTLTP